MTDPETRLAQLWAMDAPPMRDPIFENAVAARIDRRRWAQFALEVAALAVAVIAVAWAAWPFVAPSLDRAAPLLAVAVGLGLAVWSLDRTFEHSLFAGYEDFTRDLASD